MRADRNAIVIISSEYFRWRPQVRFMESFPTRAAALVYAFQHNCNLIVEGYEGRRPLFDVMQDPDGVSTADLDLQLVRTEDILVESSRGRLTALTLSSLGDLARRLPRLAAILDARQIVPLFRRAAPVVGKCVADISFLSRRTTPVACLYFREALLFSRRTINFARLFVREITPVLWTTAARCWSDSKSVPRRQSRPLAARRQFQSPQIRWSQISRFQS